MDIEVLSQGTGNNYREMEETNTVLGNWNRICGRTWQSG